MQTKMLRKMFRGVYAPVLDQSVIDLSIDCFIDMLKELDRGHTLDPFESPPFKVLHCSPLGAV